MNKENDVVISTRVRLARNLKNFPFPNRMNREQSEQLVNAVQNTVNERNNVIGLQYYDMAKLNDTEKGRLVEEHLISPDLTGKQIACGAFIKDGISVMVNEEDHLRIQTIQSGMALDECYTLAKNVDKLLAEGLDYAFSEKYGYLTSCPTNVGTAMRVSCMLHLPALTLTGQIDSLLSVVAKLGLAVRGTYGEGSQSQGCMVQISNQVTLGISEEDTIQKLSDVLKSVIEKEREARKFLMEKHSLTIEDRAFRALGTLRHARMLTTSEFMSLYSDVRLGIFTGVLQDIDVTKLDRLTETVMPSHMAGKDPLPPQMRDRKRAELVRNALS